MSGSAAATGSTNPLHGEINSYGMRCSLTAAEPLGAAELRRFAAALMAAIAAGCTAAGAKDVSHVKAILEHDSGFLHADIVGDPGTAKVEGRDGGPAERFTLVVNSVIYGLSADAVKEATESATDSIAGSFGLARACERTQEKGRR